MQNITFQPTSLTDFVDWGSTNIWSPATVPNNDDDSVIVPTIYASTTPYTYFIQINSESFSIGSLDLEANYLELYGSMAVSGDVDEGAASEIDMNGGSLSAGSLEIDGYDLQGVGTISVSGALTDNTMIVGDGLTVSAGSLTLKGTLLAADGDMTVTTPAAGFNELENGQLTAGVYEALGSSSAPSTLEMNVGSVPTTDAAGIDLAGGSIAFFDPTTQAYEPIQSSLTTVASGGVLEIGANEPLQFGDLVDDGAIILDDDQNFDPTGLTVGVGGKIVGDGAIDTPVINNGTIDAGSTVDLSQTTVDGDLVVDGAISGRGTFEIDGAPSLDFEFASWTAGTLELSGPQTQNVVFADGVGTLQLDDPGAFTGDIVVQSVLQSVGVDGQTLSGSFELLLEGISYSSVTGYSYEHSGDSGLLTIDTSAGDYSFAFSGDLQRSDFALSAGPQVLSTLPPSLEVTVSPQTNLAATMTPSDFSGEGLSDVLWRNADGDVAIWNSAIGSSQYSSQEIADVSPDWQVAGVGDFNGAPSDGVLWRDSNGDVTTWNASPSSPETFAGNGGATYYVSTDWQVAGVADFNGDGLSDVLWRNASGDVDIWSANAGSSPVSFTPQPTLYVSTDWQIEGVGDFDGSGKDGVLWRNANTGDVTIWNASASPTGFTANDLGEVSSDWTIAGVGDFDPSPNGQESNSSGQSDILWRNSNGDTALWVPKLGSPGYTSIDLGYVSTDWQVQGVGDYNGDGVADILWRNTNTGDVTVWDSTSAPFKFAAENLGIVSADWQIATAASLRSA